MFYYQAGEERLDESHSRGIVAGFSCISSFGFQSSNFTKWGSSSRIKLVSKGMELLGGRMEQVGGRLQPVSSEWILRLMLGVLSMG